MTVAINLTDAPSFQPNNLTVANGTAVSFTLKNVGTLNHTFTLLKTPNLLVPRNVTPQQLDSVVANATWVNYPLAPGASAGFNLTFTAPFANGSSLATYEYLSTVPYQYQSGMLGYVNVTSAPKGPPQVLFLNGTGSYQWVPQDLGVSVTSLPVRSPFSPAISAAWTTPGRSTRPRTIPRSTRAPGRPCSRPTLRPPGPMSP